MLLGIESGDGDMRFPLVGVAISLLVLAAVGCAGTDDAPDTAAVEPDAATGSFDEDDASSPDSVYSEACGRAVAAAAAIDDMQDTVEDLDPAIAVCADFDELVAAFEDYPLRWTVSTLEPSLRTAVCTARTPT
jgi:hypothetical protein